MCALRKGVLRFTGLDGLEESQKELSYCFKQGLNLMEGHW
jgi:hypothetical protein